MKHLGEVKEAFGGNSSECFVLNKGMGDIG